QPRPDRSQLQADVAAADDDQVLGDSLKSQRFRGADDVFAVERREGQARRLTAGRKQDGPRLQVLLLVPLDRDFPLAGKVANALKKNDMVFAKEIGYSVGQAFDDVVLTPQHARQIQLDIAHLDTMLLEPRLGDVIKLARIE